MGGMFPPRYGMILRYGVGPHLSPSSQFFTKGRQVGYLNLILNIDLQKYILISKNIYPSQNLKYNSAPTSCHWNEKWNRATIHLSHIDIYTRNCEKENVQLRTLVNLKRILCNFKRILRILGNLPCARYLLSSKMERGESGLHSTSSSLPRD